MPRPPETQSHATHDLELIVAYAAGDATGSELETAMSLVAACTECAALHHDLRAITAALPELPAPVRHRDFRLTEAQAAALRPAGWRRFVGIFAGPRFSFAAPLGTGLATIGIAVLVLSSNIGLPFAAGGATSVERAVSGDAAGTAAPPVAGPQAPDAASPVPSAADALGFSSKGSPVPVASAVPGMPDASSPGPTAAPQPQADDNMGSAADEGASPAVPLAILALVLGLALAGLRGIGRRVARRP
jgi:hypothetical protein